MVKSEICMFNFKQTEISQRIVYKVLSLKQDIQFYYQASWAGCLFGLEVFQRVWGFVMSGLYLPYQYFFFLNIYFHDFSVKNYLIVMQNKSGWESSVSCLKQGS